MSVTPSQPISLAADRLRTMIARSATFQLQTGASSVSQASQRVHLKNILGTDAPRPHAVISAGDEMQWGLTPGGALRSAGSLSLYIAKDTPKRYYSDIVQAEFDATNFFGAVLQEVVDQTVDVDEALLIRGINVQFWGENDEDTWQSMGRFYFLAASVSWGDGSF